ncbi:MAG: GNAT family N-acetyltransferase [Nocardioides sp.]
MSEVVVRPEETGDVDTTRRVVTEAFGGEEVSQLLDAMRADHAWLGLSFVAVEQDTGEVIGHLSFTRGWVDAPDRLVEVLVLSPVSVRPHRQRCGVGRALVHQSLELLTGRPEPLVFLEGDPAYYRRLGFVAAGTWGFTSPSVRIPEHAFQAWRRPTYDASLTGALVYPDVFWRHDAVGLRP